MPTSSPTHLLSSSIEISGVDASPGSPHLWTIAGRRTAGCGLNSCACDAVATRSKHEAVTDLKSGHIEGLTSSCCPFALYLPTTQGTHERPGNPQIHSSDSEP